MLEQIKTRRLSLRPLRVEDANDYHALETDCEVKKFLDGPSKLSFEKHRSSIALGAHGLAMTLAITAADTGKFLGRCGFTEYAEFCETIGWEINIVLHRQHWGDCYGTEVGLALIPRGFTVLGCGKILGVADAANVGSLSLCKRLGMTFERDTTRYGRPARIYAVAANAYECR
jgi:RimJ/RimL family protein N-acetyltransferase